MTSPLDYHAPPTPRIRRRFSRRGVVIVVIVALAVQLLLSVPFKQVESRIDTVTGTMIWKTTWLKGVRTSTRVDVSPLELRLKRSGIAWTSSQQFLHNVPRDVFGRAICYECGSAPAIYSLRPMMKEFADASTDDELRQFVKVMQSGTAVERLDAVNAAVEKGLKGIGQSQ